MRADPIPHLNPTVTAAGMRLGMPDVITAGMQLRMPDATTARMRLGMPDATTDGMLVFAIGVCHADADGYT